MKLLQTFTDQLQACGKLSRVWLTSFNIDMEFIETYLLPAVLETELPRTRMDYEALQLALNDSGIDFRVFCDKRYISPDQLKRTLIPVHGVSPEQQGGEIETWGFSEHSLFHAKVIYIEGEEGRVLGAGSANLTLSGWGRNREVFQFVPIETKDLYDAVRAFFQPLFDNVGEAFPKRTARKLLNQESEIRFCHSFQDEAFLTQLLGTRKHRELAIWSPYLSRDLAGFVETLRDQFAQPELSVRLVADRVDGQYLRTGWSDKLKSLFASDTLSLHQFPVSGDDRLSMTHAKLWKTTTHVAIGSWNCTRAGANTEWGEDGNWLPHTNIEAGLIFPDRKGIETYCGKALPVNEDIFATEDQLKAEALEVPEVLPFDLRVTFDWGTLTYQLEGTWNSKAVVDNDYVVMLPSVDEPLPLVWKPRTHTLKEFTVPVTDTRQLLTDHRYEILRQGKHLGSGLLIEVAARCRRAQQYDDLKSLFDAMVSDGPEPSIDDVDFRVVEGEDGEVWVDQRREGAGDDRELGQHTEFGEISYFRLFAASFQYAARLREITSLRLLEQWAFSRPGCLEELVTKSRERIKGAPPSVFNWFLAMEVNALCQLALRCRKRVDPDDEQIPLERWKLLKVPQPTLPKGADSRYKDFMQGEYKRMQRSWGVM